MGTDHLPVQPGIERQVNQNIEDARRSGAFASWDQSWVRFVARHVGAWMHVGHGLGLYLFLNASRRAPTSMHNNAITVNSLHRIRSAEHLALYNLMLTDEIDGFNGVAHLEAWNSDPPWQGVRETAERLTAVDDWCEAVFAANVVFEPLVGELFRSGLVQHAAPRRGDFVTSTILGAETYELRRARPAVHHRHVPPADRRQGIRPPQHDDPPPVAVTMGAARDQGRPDAAAVVVSSPTPGRSASKTA